VPEDNATGPNAEAPAAPPPAGRAIRRRRHLGVMISLALVVLIPVLATSWYLYRVAHPQYASTLGFSVRSEESSSALQLLGGLSALSGSSSSDTDILYEFIQSQTLVEQILEDIDLRALYSKPAYDPVFAFDPSGSIEDLVDYWQRMVRISYDSNTGLMELRVLAFDPRDARDIARKITEKSSAMINELSAVAREDTTRYARDELERAVDRLKSARQALTLFRSESRIVDPRADLQGQMGLLNSLEAQLAEAQIELNLLQETSRPGDPRSEQAQRRIVVIQQLIETERRKFGIRGEGDTGTGGTDYTTLVGEFERLSVELEYSQGAYLAAQAALDAALAEAQRQSRYLAIYVQPSLAEDSRYPERGLLVLLVAVFLLLGWAILVLIYYSLRDRR
jgi:capsular polysaccharide transport system permease protein